MSASDLSLMERLKRVLRLSSHGKGIAASMVETFADSDREGERELVRKILLGCPIEECVASLTSESKDTGDLLLYVVDQAKVNAAEASRKAEKLTSLFEHWIWMKRQRALDQKILETRSIMVSGILGGVTAMISSMAPILSSFQLSLSSPPAAPPGFSPYLGMLFVLPGASFLGIFFSRKRAYLNVAVATLAYLLVSYFFGPLVLSV